MNSLSTTRMFTYMDNVYGITKFIADPKFDLSKYTVDFEHYEHLLLYFKRYTIKLSKQILESLNKREVIPTCFGDPKDAGRDKVLVFPSSVPGFLRRSKDGLISYIDVSPRAKYQRNNNTKEAELLQISERDFYAYAQTGFLNRFCNEKAEELMFNTKFTKLIAEAYSFILYKCISSTYPIAANKNSAEILIFLCAVFAFQNFFDYDLEKSVNLALTLKGVTKSNIIHNCQFYIRLNNEFEMRSSVIGKRKGKDSKGRDTQIFPIDVFLAIIAEEFPILKSGKLEYRNLVQRFNTMYGDVAVLAIEHFFSFFAMIESAHLKVGHYNDMGIDNSCGAYVLEINTLLSTM